MADAAQSDHKAQQPTTQVDGDSNENRQGHLGPALRGHAGLGPAGAVAQAQVAAHASCPAGARENILGALPGSAADRFAIPLQTTRCLQARGTLPAAGARAGGERLITFDPPGSTFTVPSGITPDGVIVGYYVDAAGVQHGFVRTKNGDITTFDPPGATFTQPTSVTPSGEIAGAYCDTAPCDRVHGFVRTRDGSFKSFDAPGTSSSIFAGIYNPGGSPPGINPAGLIAGTYVDSGSAEHGFLRSKSGVLATIDVPGSTSTEVLAVNPSGVIVGDSSDATIFYRGFIRTPDGSFTTIDIPDSCPGNTIPSGGINAAGVVVGAFGDASCSVSHGYLREPNGAITVFDPPGSVSTDPLAINSAGAITGFFATATTNSFPHGFVRTPDGAIATFDAVGSVGTFAFGINPRGAIIGSYVDSNGGVHGFLRAP